ncbi:bromodomain-containing protein [Nannochloropsis gaditana CCMP526]|uniref:bromodomain-containing protein n=1 Tax=Nannochloropsis gaditana (strain CCMP526) TaxID=1093141 RepID=UPI00029F4EEC|nr:bromodomain-containing protein [Nannochloropsis gaditana CCMP526]EKU23152.1 bromodomain-containing protein [Nannochloropsis gaditana CCMP526]|eukprot:XP_005852683.1 bromodomain-containing protein [Nannochloropsis gaditana CCMP526]
MDLGTVHRKLYRGLYGSIRRFSQDIELVFANCERYHQGTPAPSVLAHANHLKTYARSLWLEVMVDEGGEGGREGGSVWEPAAVREKHQAREERLVFCRDLPLKPGDLRELRTVGARVLRALEEEDGTWGQMERVVGFDAFLAAEKGEGGAEGGTEGPTVGRVWEGLQHAFPGDGPPEQTVEWAGIRAEFENTFHLVTASLRERRLRGTEFSCIWAQPFRFVWAGQRKPGGSKNQVLAYWPGMVVMYGDAPEFLTRLNEARLPRSIAKELHKQRTVNKQGMSVHRVVVETFGAHDFMFYNADMVRPYTGGERREGGRGGEREGEK